MSRFLNFAQQIDRRHTSLLVNKNLKFLYKYALIVDGPTLTPLPSLQFKKKPDSFNGKRTYYDIYPYKDESYAIKGIFVPPAQKPTSQPILSNNAITSIQQILQKNLAGQRNKKQKEQLKSHGSLNDNNKYGENIVCPYIIFSLLSLYERKLLKILLIKVQI